MDRTKGGGPILRWEAGGGIIGDVGKALGVVESISAFTGEIGGGIIGIGGGRVMGGPVTVTIRGGSLLGTFPDELGIGGGKDTGGPL